jgi:alpha-D-ribose 1-methylphosphonate 5-triphosphate synthase subunit PhnG
MAEVESRSAPAVPPRHADRKAWMAELACAHADALETAWQRLFGDAPPAYQHLRAPETGMVMIQGRAGGTGKRFNAGEMTVTRCSVRLESGTVGHAYVTGRNKRHAELAAVCDALLQGSEHAGGVAEEIIAPLRAARLERRAGEARKAAATRVEFFTMVRGED